MLPLQPYVNDTVPNNHTKSVNSGVLWYCSTTLVHGDMNAWACMSLSGSSLGIRAHRVSRRCPLVPYGNGASASDEPIISQKTLPRQNRTRRAARSHLSVSLSPYRVLTRNRMSSIPYPSVLLPLALHIVGLSSSHFLGSSSFLLYSISGYPIIQSKTMMGSSLPPSVSFTHCGRGMVRESERLRSRFYSSIQKNNHRK